MKKKMLLTGILMSIGLSGCSNTQIEAPSDATVQEEVVTTEETKETVTTEETKEVEESTEVVSENRENTTFRNAVWGDDKETVKKYETEIKLEEIDGTLLGESSIAGLLDSYIMYYFDSDGKLYQGMYGIKTKEGVGAGVYISDFNQLKEKLTSLYGTPISDEIIPLTKQSQIDYAGAEKSLEFGYTAYRTIWETDTTKIMLGMQSQNYTVQTVISYQDINYKEDLSQSGL